MKKTTHLMITCLALVACETTYENEGHPYLEFGSTKQEVFDQLARSDKVSSVLATVRESILTTCRNPDLERFANSEGIAIAGASLYLKVAFKDGAVVDIFRAPAYVSFDDGIDTGHDRDSVFRAIREICRENPSADIFNFVPDGEWISVHFHNSEQIALLSKYDTWQFHENDAHSSVHVYFEYGKLVKVVRNWSPVELP